MCLRLLSGLQTPRFPQWLWDIGSTSSYRCPLSCRIFVGKGTPVVSPQAFLEFVGGHLPQKTFLGLPILTGEELCGVAMAKKSTRPQGLLDTYIAMIPKAEGGSTLLGQRACCVLPVVYRLWDSIRLAHIQDWFYSWVPDSVFST